MSRVPLATYRLQLGRDLDFAAAAELTAYLARLGVSHIYASPLFQARRGSTHGYDITDHGSVSAELGGEVGLRAWSRRLGESGLSLLVDFVPNHMGVGRADNPWWQSVLCWGQRSPRADYFDIDWRPAFGHLAGKVLVPMLGDHYGAVLERGELELVFESDTGAFAVRYYDHRFPLTPTTYASIFQSSTEVAELDAVLAELRGLAAPDAEAVLGGRIFERAAELEARLVELAESDPAAHAAIDAAVASINAEPGRARLHELLEAQRYRLAYYRVAADEINYRRFFNINELAGLRVEIPEVFDEVHRKLLELVGDAVIQGLRIDHVDGLFDPAGYLARLVAEAGERGARPYLVVEKILAEHEHLRDDWAVDGTTGYDFLAEAVEVLVDGAGHEPLWSLYRRLASPGSVDLDEAFYRAKLEIIDYLLVAELQVLANSLDRISERNTWTRDFTLPILRAALRQVVACFPVYRTYVGPESEASDEDRRDIAWAVAQARKRAPRIDDSAFDFVERAMLCELPGGLESGYDPLEVRRFALKLQQYTGPVTAKAVEDTAFYRCPIVCALNDVGADPRRFGISVSGFHVRQQQRAQRHPHSMLTTSTHDTKRGEDARARLAVLTEIPGEWAERVERWQQLNRSRTQMVGDRPAPSPVEAYLVYQAMLGCWPAELLGSSTDDLNPEAVAELTDRLCDFTLKALREAKEQTSWEDADTDYENAVLDFVRRILALDGPNVFLDDFLPFADRVAELGARNSLTQLVLKLTVPGVPDLYQGSELWDLSLVDPDNRRPVDFARRAALLAEIEATEPTEAAALLESWRDGRIKLYVLHRLLALRASAPELFAEGDYRPLAVEGRFADHVIAFERHLRANSITVVATRLPAALAGDWGDTSLAAEIGRGTDALSGDANPGGGGVRVGEILGTLPVAVLVR